MTKKAPDVPEEAPAPEPGIVARTAPKVAQVAGLAATGAAIGVGLGMAGTKRQRPLANAMHPGMIPRQLQRYQGSGWATKGGQASRPRRPHLFDREGDPGSVAPRKSRFQPAPEARLYRTAQYGNQKVREVAGEHPLGGFRAPIPEAPNKRQGIAGGAFPSEHQGVNPRTARFLHPNFEADKAAARTGGGLLRRISRAFLTKRAPDAFDETKHPRGTHGQFAAAGSHAERHEHNVQTLVRAGVLPKLVTHPDGSVVEHAGTTRKVISGPTPRAADRTQEPINDSRWMQEPRSRATMPGYYRTASKTPGMPVQYTGSDRKEEPVGRFLVHQLTDQKPRSVSAKDHHELKASLFNMVTELAEPTIAQGKLPKRRGKLRGQTLIPEGTPEITARRAFTHAAMTALHTYGTLKYDFAMDDKLKEELKPLSGFMLYAQRRVMNDMFAGEKGNYQPYREEFGETFADGRRDKRTGEVRLHMTPRKQLIKAERIGSLAKAFAPGQHPRGPTGRWVTLGALGAGSLATAYVARQRSKAAEEYGPASEDSRNTSMLTVGTALRFADQWPAHARDVLSGATSVGAKPTGKQLRRQFARDSFIGREREIVVGHDGTVLQNIKGSAGEVGRNSQQAGDLVGLLRAGRVARMIHNHPVDYAPSPSDALSSFVIGDIADQLGQKAPIQRVYGFGRTPEGKSRVRVTRFDGVPRTLVDAQGDEADLDFEEIPLSHHSWTAAQRDFGSNYRTKAVEKLAKAFEECKRFAQQAHSE